MLSTSWPFVFGLCCGWVLVVVRHMPAASARSGAILTVVTVAIGMVLRVVAGQGTALAFIGVALAFLGLALIGWRLIVVATSSRTS